MTITITPDTVTCGKAAADLGARRIREAITLRNRASIIVATGMSQVEMLDALIAAEGIAWEHVTVFHLDEYVGLPVTHPASFRRYLWERFQRRLPRPLQAMHYISGDGDPRQECRRLGALLREQPVIDVCFAGIGENGHLAFNDPPADFTTDEPYLVVSLDENCRRQQVGEGWFADLEAVPREAISMSIRQIMRSRTIVITAADQRKARALRDSTEGPVSPEVPASILQQHADVAIFTDPAGGSLLTRAVR